MEGRLASSEGAGEPDEIPGSDPGISDPYLSARVAELLEQIAARTPAPGGGAAAALTCAMAASLAQLNVSMLSRHALADAHLERLRPSLARATRARERAVIAYAHV